MSYDQEVEELLAQYRTEREQALENRRRINETTATVAAPRQTVKVTVNAQGDVSAIEFPTGAYRRMAPKELAEALLGAIKQARAKAIEEVHQMLSDRLPAGVSIPDLLRGQVDSSALLPETPGMPDRVREYLARGRPSG
ncbi:YbaB/EbfC family nucleoid-associated protein [Streptacidiphilus sp. ASG 303]|uniref:YbaB/EbfC family nucleoid-associated protein n=1 Tax=Streptacidiphilus sp. ASG 303 TaxID=2896847 RepID=UPI001E52C81E|nr:YbaB/EbfC family nucleoid-associated protein [Streptacidiphilus sp. ASG 303]MCD0484101.1 YbaB/EbfC family nucleoid-associated protein [Streptacidiphilus sp. ASG 303]